MALINLSQLNESIFMLTYVILSLSGVFQALQTFILAVLPVIITIAVIGLILGFFDEIMNFVSGLIRSMIGKLKR